jgi:hypothetical protein
VNFRVGACTLVAEKGGSINLSQWITHWQRMWARSQRKGGMCIQNLKTNI